MELELGDTVVSAKMPFKTSLRIYFSVMDINFFDYNIINVYGLRKSKIILVEKLENDYFLPHSNHYKKSNNNYEN